jgi:hypothetical protein
MTAVNYQICFRSRAHPGLAGISFTHAADVEATKAKLECEGYEIVSVTPVTGAARKELP